MFQEPLLIRPTWKATTLLDVKLVLEACENGCYFSHVINSLNCVRLWLINKLVHCKYGIFKYILCSCYVRNIVVQCVVFYFPLVHS